MRKYKYFLILFVILGILSLACSIERIPSENPVSLKNTNTPIPTATCTNPVSLKIIGTVNVAEGLNLRKEPSEHSAVITTLSPESKVEILSEEENGWLCVKIEQIQDDMTIKEITGYVNGNYIDY